MVQPTHPRNYKHATEYEDTPEQVKHREERNAARRRLEKAGRVHKGDGMDVDHKNPLAKGGSNAPSNQRVVSKAFNRSWRSRQPGMYGKG